MSRCPIAALLTTLLFASLAAAGPLTPPPGPITPTGKSLDAIEPRVCLNDLPGDEGAVVIVSAPGQYFLRANIQGEAGKHGIRITTSGDVSIDLNGFVVQGAPASLNGIDMDLGSQTVVGSRLAIRCPDGTCRASVTGWGGDGVRTSGVIECSCTHLLVEDCAGAGIRHLHAEGIVHRDVATRNCLSDGTVVTPPTQARAGKGVTNRFMVCRARGNGGNGWNITTRPTASDVHFMDTLACGNGLNGVSITEDATAPGHGNAGEGRNRWDRHISRDNAGAGVLVEMPVGSGMVVEANDTTCMGSAGAGFEVQVSNPSSHGGSVHVYRRCSFNNNGTDGLRSHNPVHVENTTMSENVLFGTVVEGNDPNESVVVFNVCHLIANGSGGADIPRGRFSNYRCVISDNGGPGVQTGDGCLLMTECSVTNNSGAGVTTNGTLNVVSSDFRRNGNEGVRCANGSCVADGMVCEFNGTNGTGSPGASFFNCDEVVLRNCVSNANDGPGFRATTDGSVGPIRWMAPESLATNNGGHGFDLNNCDGGVLDRCKASGNSGVGIHLGMGFVNGRVEGCSSTGDGSGGIWVLGTGNLVISCGATANPVGAFDIRQGNAPGPIISAAEVATSCNPRANVVY